jgi:hypothetical protein
MADQTEKAYQQQPLFNNHKNKKFRRWYKDVGLGFKVC